MGEELFTAAEERGVLAEGALFQASADGRVGFSAGHKVRKSNARGVVRVKRIFPGGEKVAYLHAAIG